MIHQAMIVTMAAFGQIYFDVCPPPIYLGPPVVHVPTDYIRIELDGMTERSRRYEYVEYASGWRKVPVINGYVPEVSRCNFRNGDREFVYNYSKRIRLAECNCEPVETPTVRAPKVQKQERRVEEYDAPPRKAIKPKEIAPAPEQEYEPEAVAPFEPNPAPPFKPTRPTGKKKPSEIPDLPDNPAPSYRTGNE